MRKLISFKIINKAFPKAYIVIKNLGGGMYECVAVVNKKKVASIIEKRGVILIRKGV